jgi:hypothetical protein
LTTIPDEVTVYRKGAKKESSRLSGAMRWDARGILALLKTTKKKLEVGCRTILLVGGQ